MRNVENRWEERRAPERPERRALLGVRLGFPSWEPAVTVRAVSRAMHGCSGCWAVMHSEGGAVGKAAEFLAWLLRPLTTATKLRHGSLTHSREMMIL